MKKLFCLTLGVIFMLTASAGAKSIRTPEGNFPRVQWAVVESTEGTMPQIVDMGARILASNTAKESGTYALYGAIERDNPNLMRLLEIYESDEAAAQRYFASDEYKAYRKQVAALIKDEHAIDYAPTKIVLSEKF